MRTLLAAVVAAGGHEPIDPDLAIYLDTLLPADDASPSASAIGVPERLLAKAGENGRYRRLLIRGARWLDREARRLGAENFAALADDGRELIVARAARAPANTLERIFFEHTRADAFTHYYADPATWNALGYQHSPQPLGFVDHHLPPPADRY